MTRLGLKGLEQALWFPETRIRFSDSLPLPTSPRLLGIQITGNGRSFFENLTVAFAENLSCLIGVRGSGKSTIVEALRYAFGYNRTLEELEKLETPIRDMQKANLTGALIRVAYQTRTGEHRVLATTFDEKADYGTKVFSATGDPLEVADVEQCGDYPLRLFGWSEIETLGRSPARQRDLLDRLIPELSPPIRDTVLKCIEEVKAAFEKNGSEIQRYREYRTDFEKLNTPEVKGLFSAMDLAQDKRRVLAQLLANATALIEKLTNPASVSLRAEIDTLLARGNSQLRDWWHEEELARLAVMLIEADVARSLQQAAARIQAFQELLQEHIRQTDSESEHLQQDLRIRFAADDTMQRVADLRANAETRLRRVTEVRDLYQKAFERLQASIRSHQAVADDLAKTQHEIAGIRAARNAVVGETLNRFLPGEMAVSIDFQAGRDTTKYAERLYKVFGARGNQAKRIRHFVERFTTPVSFVEMVLKGDLNDLVGKEDTFEDNVVQFSSDDATACLQKLRPFELNESADVQTLIDNGRNLETILDLQETPWDDHETILLNGGPVNEKSPGQRSSAMLPLIALAETTPLIIDQPEDNLDKRLIGSVLIKVLAELKEKRQIIVCTHDPNILVGGDAEQVIVLEAESDRKGKVALHGSIDNDDIVKTVISLLEGGREAFETRRKRYGANLTSP
jgi:predicted ATP-dependent endonuclease of OLD family